MDQTRHEAKTEDHEFEDSKMIKLLSRVCAFYEEGHVIMDCPFFVPFHTRTSIAKHAELQNVARTLINQP